MARVSVGPIERAFGYEDRRSPTCRRTLNSLEQWNGNVYLETGTCAVVMLGAVDQVRDRFGLGSASAGVPYDSQCPHRRAWQPLATFEWTRFVGD